MRNQLSLCKVKVYMQKQLKIIDTELQINHLARLQDPIPKPANSFFRALSISLFSTHNETQFVRSVMKLTLEANCKIYQSNGPLLKIKKKQEIPFPLISQNSQLVKKYLNDKSMLELYGSSPDLECFQNDNYELASFTFNRRVSIFYLNKDGYLNEMLISSCRNKTGKKIILTKLGKRFFAVQRQNTKLMTNFIRQYLLGNLINKIISDDLQKQNTRIHFSGYDQIVINSHKKFPKAHKKSLSECGDIMNKLEQFQAGYAEESKNFNEIKNFHANIKNIYDSIQNRSHQEEPINLLDREFDFCQKDREPEGVQNISKSFTQMGLQSKQGDLNDNYQKQIVQAYKKQNQPNQSHLSPAISNLQNQSQLQTAQIESAQNDVKLKEDQTTLYLEQQAVKAQEKSTQQLTLQQQITEGHETAQTMQAQTFLEGTMNVEYAQNYYSPQQYAIYSGYQMNHQYYSPDYSAYYNMHPMIYQNQYYQYYQQPQQETYTYSQPQELVQSNRYRGRLKFYDSNGKYGFLIVDGIGSDLFVHFDDLSKAGVSKQHLDGHSSSRQLRFQFTYYEYQGKNKKAKKAIDLVLLP